MYVMGRQYTYTTVGRPFTYYGSRLGKVPWRVRRFFRPLSLSSADVSALKVMRIIPAQGMEL